MSPLEDQIGALLGLPTHDPRIAWRRLYRSEPPRCLNRDLLIRAIACRMQQRTGWQPHTVRGFSFERLRKKLGLKLGSAQEDRGRVYRIGDADRRGAGARADG